MPIKNKAFDITVILLPLFIIMVSLSVIYSLVLNTPDSGLIMKQGIASLIGFFILGLTSFTDYRFFRGTAWIFYIITLLLLLYVDFFGLAAGGAMRWINLGFFQLQPSELAKIVLILVFSGFFSQKIGKLSIKDIMLSLLMLLPPLFLVLKEPDLGTALVLCFIYLALLLIARPSKKLIFIILGGIFLMAAVFLLAVYNVKPFDRLVHDYQRNRIQIFINPDLDPYGKGYHVRQAQIAIGAGGISGKGLGKGSQSQLQFLPKPHTDFIFSGIAEAYGFFGTGVFVAFFVLLILRIISIANLARDNFGMFICFGMAAMLIFQTLINIGMNLGLAPVTGIPLPFSSYGGSAMVAYLFLIGLVESIFIRHKKISF